MATKIRIMVYNTNGQLDEVHMFDLEKVSSKEAEKFTERLIKDGKKYAFSYLKD